MEEHLSFSKNRQAKKDDWGIGQPLGW